MTRTTSRIVRAAVKITCRTRCVICSGTITSLKLSSAERSQATTRCDTASSRREGSHGWRRLHEEQDTYEATLIRRRGWCSAASILTRTDTAIRKKMVYEQGEKAAPGRDVAEYCGTGIDPKSLGGVKGREQSVNGGRRMPPHEARKCLILL